MFDLRPVSPLQLDGPAADTSGGPAREWADALILDLVMEREPDRRVFVGSRGALAARLGSATSAPE